VNPIKAGFISLSAGAEGGDDDRYLAWHLLDHLPEQYSIPGIRLGTRWRVDDACLDACLAADASLADVRHAVAYLMTDPLPETLTAFAQLGRRAAETGRFPVRAASRLLGAFHLQQGYASPRVLVSAEAIPFRPHRGVLLLVERVTDRDVAAWMRWHHTEHIPALLLQPSVAGAYLFRSSTLLGVGPDQGARFGMPLWDPGDRVVTIVYLDGDPAATTTAVGDLVRSRWASGAVEVELALPLRSMVTYAAWPSP
jgi:hypothetical protein